MHCQSPASYKQVVVDVVRHTPSEFKASTAFMSRLVLSHGPYLHGYLPGLGHLYLLHLHDVQVLRRVLYSMAAGSVADLSLFR
jgi:hypothetical protein